MNTQEFIGAANAADEDTANYIKQVSEQARALQNEKISILPMSETLHVSLGIITMLK